MAVRLIDGNVLKQWCEKIIDQACHPATVQIGEAFLDKVRSMPTLTPPNEWVSVEERLPESTECWKTYIVTVNRSHWPTSSYDLCDAPYNEELVAVAQYDSKQKIWHLSWDEQLNALIQADDAPLNGDFVTHWMPLPEPSGKEG